MRTWSWVGALAGIAVLASPVAAVAISPDAGPAQSLQRLNPPTARVISAKLVRRAVRRSERLQESEFRACERRRGRIDCVFVARGTTENAEFDCRLKVSVRGRHGHPAGRIVARTCQQTLRPLLSGARAREAMASVAEARTGSDALLEVERTSRSAFQGVAAWPPDGERAPICVLELSAELEPSGAVLVKTHGVTCAA
jgi:hypothetical protein